MSIETALVAQSTLLREYDSLGKVLLNDTNGEGGLENDYRTLLIEVISQAVDELAEIFEFQDLDIEKAKEGGRQTLSQVDKRRFFEKFCDIVAPNYDYLDYILIRNRLISSMDDSEVLLAGPLVIIECLNDKSISTLSGILSNNNVRGGLLPLPIGISASKGIDASDSLFLMFIDKSSEKYLETKRHEEWHFIMALRRKLCKILLKKNFDESDELMETGDPAFEQRFSQCLYSPQDLDEQLKKLDQASSVMYDYFVGIKYDQSKLGSYFGILQEELCAFIFSRISLDGQESMCEVDELFLEDLMKYLPLVDINFLDLKMLCGITTENNHTTGKYFPDEEQVKRFLQPRVGVWQLDNSYFALKKHYEGSAGDFFLAERVLDFDRFMNDLEYFVDFFLNESGVYESIKNKMRVLVKDAYISFVTLAQFYKDPYLAILDLSSIPFPNWGIWVKRKTRN